MRNISASLTADQIRQSFQNVCNGLPPVKDVTRRVGWLNLKPGEQLQVCEKCQGIKKGESMVRIAIIEVVSARREPLNHLLGIPADRGTEYGFKEVIREGFPAFSPLRFVQFFCSTHKDCTPATLVTRIEFKYILRCSFGACTKHRCTASAIWSSTYDGRHTGLLWCDEHKVDSHLSGPRHGLQKIKCAAPR